MYTFVPVSLFCWLRKMQFFNCSDENDHKQILKSGKTPLKLGFQPGIQNAFLCTAWFADRQTDKTDRQTDRQQPLPVSKINAK